MIPIEQSNRETVAAKKAEKLDWKNKMADMSEMTFPGLEQYIDENVNNLAEAKQFLKKLSKAVLGLMKLYEENQK